MCICDSLNVVSDSRLLTQRLESSIKEKRDLAAKIRSERSEKQGEMKEEK
jgi:hypothetical protein